MLNDYFISRDLDFLLLIETWIKPGDNSAYSEILPPNCLVIHARTTGHGGDLAIIHKNTANCRNIYFDKYLSFELLVSVISNSGTMLLSLVYRPPKYS